MDSLPVAQHGGGGGSGGGDGGGDGGGGDGGGGGEGGGAGVAVLLLHTGGYHEVAVNYAR